MRIRLGIACVAFALTVVAYAQGPGEAAKLPEPVPAQQPAAGAVEKAPGLIHTVVFWLREDLTDEERNAFVQDNQSLRNIPSVRNLFFGPPAPTEPRPIIDDSYDYLLILQFDDLAGQNAYQVDPLHKRMLEEHRDKWTRILVYDSAVLDGNPADDSD